MKRARTLAALAVSALALAACAPATRSGWAPPSWPPEVVHLTAPVPEITAARDGPLGAGIEPLRVRNDAVGVQARVALLPASAGTADFNARVEQYVRAAIADRVAATGVAYTPSPVPPGSGLGDRRCAAGSTTLPATAVLADPDLGPAGGSGTAVVCGIVAAGGTIVGQRVRVVSGDAAQIRSDVTTVLYADVLTGETVTADALWGEGAAAVLGAHIVEALRRDAARSAIGRRSKRMSRSSRRSSPRWPRPSPRPRDSSSRSRRASPRPT